MLNGLFVIFFIVVILIFYTISQIKNYFKKKMNFFHDKLLIHFNKIKNREHLFSIPIIRI